MRRKTQAVKQTDAELLRHLEEQVRFLTNSIDLFDAGDEAEGKRIAAVLRVLLHDSPTSHSLLGLIGVKRLPFRDTHRTVTGRLITSHCGFLGWTRPPGNTHWKWTAHACMDYLPAPKSLPFDTWWSSPVIRLQSGEPYTRRDIVTFVANEDGGAHVDPLLTERFHHLSRANGMAWTSRIGDGDSVPMAGPELASVRQIAFELLATLEKHLPAAIPPERRLPRAARRRL